MKTPNTDLIKPKTKSKSKSKSKVKGKGKESVESNHTNHNDHQHTPKSPPPLPHDEDAGPSGFGTANEDYNTLTAEYLEAAQHTGYDGRVKDVENEGPLIEGSKAWVEAREEDEAEDKSAVVTPIGAIDGTDEFRNVWDK